MTTIHIQCIGEKVLVPQSELELLVVVPVKACEACKGSGHGVF